jgi:hypothetical protein
MGRRRRRKPLKRRGSRPQDVVNTPQDMVVPQDMIAPQDVVNAPPRPARGGSGSGGRPLPYERTFTERGGQSPKGQPQGGGVPLNQFPGGNRGINPPGSPQHDEMLRLQAEQGGPRVMSADERMARGRPPKGQPQTAQAMQQGGRPPKGQPQGGGRPLMAGGGRPPKGQPGGGRRRPPRGGRRRRPMPRGIAV